MCGMAEPSKSMKAEQDSWRAEDDHRTLTRAAEISADTSRMKGVQKHHRKVQKRLQKVGSLIRSRR